MGAFNTFIGMWEQQIDQSQPRISEENQLNLVLNGYTDFFQMHKGDLRFETSQDKD